MGQPHYKGIEKFPQHVPSTFCFINLICYLQRQIVRRGINLNIVRNIPQKSRARSNFSPSHIINNILTSLLAVGTESLGFDFRTGQIKYKVAGGFLLLKHLPSLRMLCVLAYICNLVKVWTRLLVIRNRLITVVIGKS